MSAKTKLPLSVGGTLGIPPAAVLAVRDEVRRQVFEMDDVVDLSLVALLARQHLCLLGKPGAAKSKALTAITRRITGCQFFLRLLQKTSTPEELFGPVMLSELRQDRYTRQVKGMLPTAHVGFVDEVFKANSAILNSMLTLMNERRYDNGDQNLACPLVSLFGASNEMPQEDGLAALWDRFVLRTVVDYMSDETSYVALWSARASGAAEAPPSATLTLAQLQSAQAQVAAVVLERPVMDKLLQLRRELLKVGIEVSPRRWSDTVPVLQARAWLSGRTAVNDDDLQVLTHVLWVTMEQRTSVRKTINGVVNPAREEALALYDSAAQTVREFEALPANQREEGAVRVAPKLRGAGQRFKEIVEGLAREGREVADLTAKLEQLRVWHRGLVDSAIGGV